MAATGVAPVIVVMGVSGCGKSTVAAAIGQALGLPFLEGDKLHSAANVARMASGTPLTDADRAGWLELLAQRIARSRADGAGLVLACSALKRAYRDVLRRGASDLVLVYLRGAPALLAERTAARSGHYMPASLLGSQLATLEPPQLDEIAVDADIAQPVQIQVAAILAALRRVLPPACETVAVLQDAFMTQFSKTVLFTDTDGRARFRQEMLALPEGSPQSMLSPLFPSAGYQLRHSPVGFRSSFHCTGAPQWVFILQGRMEIGLQGGESRVFGPGEHFYSADVLPAGAVFDPVVHGHWSRQVGPDPLVTLFVRG